MSHTQAQADWQNHIKTYYENHQLRLLGHLALTIVTFGMWLIVWCFLMLQSYPYVEGSE